MQTAPRHYDRYSLLFLIIALLATVPMFGVNVKSYGAIGDGIHNDTAAINAAFQAGCNNSVYFPRGVYLVDPLAAVTGCSYTVYGDGYKLSVLRANSNVSPIYPSIVSFVSGNTFTVRDMSFDGAKKELLGVDIENYSAVTIRNISSHNFGNPGYAQGYRSSYDGLYLINTKQVRVSDSFFTANERQGVELQADHDSLVSNTIMSGNGNLGGVSEQNFSGPLDGPLFAQWVNNVLVGNGGGGIDVETDPSLPPAHGIMRSNYVKDCGNNNWASGWGLVIGNHAFGTIKNNVVLNFAANAPYTNYTSAIVYGDNGGEIEILGNTVIGTKSNGILGNYGLFPVTVSRNNLLRNGVGVFLYSSPGSAIEYNNIGDSVGAGIMVDVSNPITISGNRFFNNHPNVVIDGVTQ